ncbi:hypothetical protein OE88DRAFT_1812500 [Heliocybe sulcata]|uniref:Uncharacterized protein n=1 Tax=Heliocybe sulcata TaxID=5364 RepID=A0A5C3MJV5_9AGAM|nr:hypothetical protein OE88DRAFT_1812500 [Heliocybe sulcata]
MVFVISSYSDMFAFSNPRLYVYSQDTWHIILATPTYGTSIFLGSCRVLGKQKEDYGDGFKEG